MKKLKLVYSSILASVVSITFITVVTIWAEVSKPLKDWLQGITGHHWVTKSVFSLVVYLTATAVFYFLTKQVDGRKVHRLLIGLIFVTILGIIAIFAFYTLHYFKLL